MLKHKKIAVLNLQVDGNYGGHLQRYALITILQRMGYDVTHLNTRFPNSKKSLLKYMKGGGKRLLLYLYYWIVRSPEYKPIKYFKYYIKHEPVTEDFYDRYIPHTPRIYTAKELAQYLDYDCYVVGSDQVWRKWMAECYGLSTYFFDYLPQNKSRIAYGVSFGTNENELNTEDVDTIFALYKRFKAVSVRETSGLSLLQSYGCTNPEASLVLDPTVLLFDKDYNVLIERANISNSNGGLFCYVLDLDDDKKRIIEEVARRKGLATQIWTADLHYTVEKWLQSIRDAEYVITDSYHGMLFSIIFKKQFKLLGNGFRGNARFESVASMLDFDISAEAQNYDAIYQRIEKYRNDSMRFIQQSIG